MIQLYLQGLHTVNSIQVCRRTIDPESHVAEKDGLLFYLVLALTVGKCIRNKSAAK